MRDEEIRETIFQQLAESAGVAFIVIDDEEARRR
jgi:hypothetical protein